jgi:hypothetical protein
MTERRVRTFSPEYGTLRTLLLVGTLATAAAVLAPDVAAAVGLPPLEYALYGVAAVLAVAALLYEGARQRETNPREFVARDVLARFYEQQRPSPAEHLLHLLASAAGVAAAWFGAGPALSRREGALLVLERATAGEPVPSVDPTNAAWGAVVLAGVVLAAVGLDRLLVGLYRELRYRRARR